MALSDLLRSSSRHKSTEPSTSAYYKMQLPATYESTSAVLKSCESLSQLYDGSEVVVCTFIHISRNVEWRTLNLFRGEGDTPFHTPVSYFHMMIMLYTETMYIYIFSIYIWLFCVAFTHNKSHWNLILLLRHWISRNKTLMQFMF